MNLRESNNAFREEYSKVLRESTLSKKDEIRELLRTTARDCTLRGDNKKGMEVALQAAMKSQFPDNQWWEVTNCNICTEMLSGKPISEVLDCIVDGIKPEFLEETPTLGNDTDIGDDATLVIEETVTMDGDDLSEDELQDALNEWNEFSDDDVEDDYMHSQVYGGDSRYCHSCGSVKEYDEEGFSFCPECDRSDNIEEDVFADWKPDTSFKHIKDIYNKLKSNGYVYANNEREEFMAAVRKADEGGYKPEECRQIKQWHRDVWQNRRDQMHQSYMKEDSQSAGKTISRATLARLRNKR